MHRNIHVRYPLCLDRGRDDHIATPGTGNGTLDEQQITLGIDAHDVEPDMLCMAKGIASGFPFAGLGMRGSIASFQLAGALRLQ